MSTNNSSTNGAEIPRDAKLIQNILTSMGVEEYEPRVVNQLLEFMYRYVSDVLQDASQYAHHASKSEISLDDIRLAIQSKVNYSFTQPPPRELLLELAHSKNITPIPVVPPRLGVHLPPDEYCMTAPNFQLDPKKKPPAKREEKKDTTTAAPAPTATSTTPGKVQFTLTKKTLNS